MAALAAPPRDGEAPRRQMERRTLGMRAHELGDARGFGGIGQIGGPQAEQRRRHAIVLLISATIESIRSQWWRRISPRSLPAIAPSRL